MINKMVVLLLLLMIISVKTNSNNIDSAKYFTGGTVGTIAGFGIGHAIQDRYWDKGWIFTLGESTSVFVFVVSLLVTKLLVDNASSTPMPVIPMAFQLGGAASFLGFRVWEIVDVWSWDSNKIKEGASENTIGQKRSSNFSSVFPIVSIRF